MRPRNAAASGTAHVRWVWLPSPGRVALQRSCALQLLQFVDSTIGLAMLPRRFDCFNCTRVAHAHDDLSRQPQPYKQTSASRRTRAQVGYARLRLSSTESLFVWRAEPARSDCCRRGAKRAGSTRSRWSLEFISLLPELPLGAIDRCASERLRRRSPLHLSNI